MFDKETYVQLTKDMKSADTTAENKATPWARATLTALLERNAEGEATFTVASMTQALCAVYKPRTKSGKLANTIGSLPPSPRGRATTMKYIVDNMGVEGVRPVVDAFMTSTKATIAELQRDVKSAIKAQVTEPEQEQEQEQEQETPKAFTSTLPDEPVDVLAMIADHIRTMTVADYVANIEAVNAILDAITNKEAERVTTTDLALAA